VSTQDPYRPPSEPGWQPAGYPTSPAPTYEGGYPTRPPSSLGGAYGTPPPYQAGGYPTSAPPVYVGHPAFAPYGTPTTDRVAPSPEYGYPAATAQYGYPAYGNPMQAYGGAPTYAHWGLRVAAMLLDLLAWIPYWIGLGIASTLSTPGIDEYGYATTVTTPTGNAVLVLGGLASLGLWVWNRGFRQARTGQSWGKKIVGLRLARQEDGSNLGVGRALTRDLTHWLDCWVFYLGFWFPLWDAKRQTFADKIVKTVVVR
jgi:uncharacterized RDD family membrane protein YckC